MAGIGGEPAEWVNCVGANPGKHLHSVVSRARRLGTVSSPTANGRSDLLGTIELGDAQFPEMIGDPVKPRSPLRLVLSASFWWSALSLLWQKCDF